MRRLFVLAAGRAFGGQVCAGVVALITSSLPANVPICASRRAQDVLTATPCTRPCPSPAFARESTTLVTLAAYNMLAAERTPCTNTLKRKLPKAWRATPY